MVKKSVTLVELLIVMIIIGLLAGFVVPNFSQARMNAIDREARAMLVLIRAGEQAHAAEGLGYVDCADAACMNATFANGGLGLDLPVGGNWSYSTDVGVAGNTFCAAATGGPSGNNFCITQNISQAQLQGCGAAPCNY